MLHIAQHYDIPVGEVAVNWTEIDGQSQVVLRDVQDFIS